MIAGPGSSVDGELLAFASVKWTQFLCTDVTCDNTRKSILGSAVSQATKSTVDFPVVLPPAMTLTGQSNTARPTSKGFANMSGMRTDIVERRAKLEGSDRSFDLRFWQAQSPRARFDAAWELILHHAKVKGLDVRQLRLQRSVETFQRRQG